MDLEMNGPEWTSNMGRIVTFLLSKSVEKNMAALAVADDDPAQHSRR